MLTVVCGTNRPENTTRLIAEVYHHKILEAGQAVQLLRLEDLPKDFAFANEAYGDASAEFTALVDKYVRGVNKLVIVSPEYNGSIPGVLKAFIDGIMPADMKGKKAALVGVASGRAGNIRGMDHLTNILNYLDVDVLPLKVPISGVYQLLNEERELADQLTLDVIDNQLKRFLAF